MLCNKMADCANGCVGNEGGMIELWLSMKSGIVVCTGHAWFMYIACLF